MSNTTVSPAQSTTAGSHSSISLADAAAFIWAEADLLDRHDYAAWLTLWTETGRYVIPIDQDEDTDPADALNIAYDDAEMRHARVKRLRSGFAMSSAPAARTARTVSRFVIVKDDAESVEVRAVQHIAEHKFERTRILAADVLYRLVQTEAGLRLDRKEVRLINSDDPLWGIGYLL